MLAMNLDNKGLLTYANQLSQVPPGSMIQASNVVIDQPGVVETRRGLLQYANLVDSINQLTSYKNRLIALHGTTLAYDSDGLGTFSDYTGSYSPASGVPKVHFNQANSNLYFNTNNGIYILDSLAGEPILAGVPAGLDLSAAIDGTSGFLDNSSQCAYVITWSYYDANNNLKEGTPSAYTVLANSSGNPTNADLTFTIPDGITTDYLYNIYRTPQTDSLSVAPGDNYQLAYSANPTSGQITAKVVTYTDILPDVLLGAYCYTSSASQGPAQTNDVPPLAVDFCNYLGMTFYANVSTLQSKQFGFVSVGTDSSTFEIGDTITIVSTSTHVYTGHASNVAASQYFEVVTSGTTAENLDATARNFCAMVNQDPNNSDIYAYYNTAAAVPGIVTIKARNLSLAAFSIKSSKGATFSPVIPSSGTSFISSNSSLPNGIYISKVGQPEAVPLSNLDLVGTGLIIYRVIALRDGVQVWTNNGVWKGTGTDPISISFQQIDKTVNLLALETNQALNNSIYGWSSQGIVSVVDSSQIVSRPIEGTLLQISSDLYTNFSDLTFAVSYESDRKYIIFTNSATDNTFSTIQYVYNWITNCWTTWDLQATSAAINTFDDKLYVGQTDGTILKERKDYTQQDYADREWDITITNITDNVLTVTGTITDAQIGDTVGQGVTNGSGGIQSIITNIDYDNNLITVENASSFSVDAAVVYEAIDAIIQYSPITCNFPSYMKRFQNNMQFVFSKANFESVDVSFSSDISVPNDTVSLVPVTSSGFGELGWGTDGWGVSSNDFQTIPTYLSRNTMFCHWLNITVELKQTFQNMALNGIMGFYTIVTDRFR